MADLGFKKSHVDDNLYILRDENGVILLVLAYVDDTIPASPSLDHIIKFKLISTPVLILRI